MAVDDTAARDRGPRRARYLIPRGTPRRAEIIAGLGFLLVLGHLVLAQLTGLVAIALWALTRLTRWRLVWLAAPAAAGGLAALAIGPARAVGGLVAGPAEVLAYFAGAVEDPGRLITPPRAFAGIGGWLPRQLPLALVLGAAEAALACRLRWMHTDEWRVPPPRPGLAVALRRALTVRRIRSGGVVSRDGATVGVDPGTGARAGLSWREIATGVLCAGSSAASAGATAAQIGYAAIRRRKPLIVIDLSAAGTAAGPVAAACAATGTPLRHFSPAGPVYYDPMRGSAAGGDAARRAALVLGMVDWSGTGEQYRRGCAAYLEDLFAVVDAAPGDPRAPGLEEVAHLLDPAVLAARARHIPAYHPGRDALIERVAVSGQLFAADPQAGAVLGGLLRELGSGAFGRWLRPDPEHAAGPAPGLPPAAEIDLESAVRERAVVLFSLGGAATGRAAATLAALVVQDVLAVCEELRRIQVDGDGLVWVEECSALPPNLLAELVAGGREAGLPALLSTASVAAADRLAEYAGAYLIHRIDDPRGAARFARLTGERLVPGDLPPMPATPSYEAVLPVDGTTATPPGAGPGLAGGSPGGGPAFVRTPAVAAETIADLPDQACVLVARAPRRRLVPLVRLVRGLSPDAEPPPAPGAAAAPAAGPPAPHAALGPPTGAAGNRSLPTPPGPRTSGAPGGPRPPAPPARRTPPLGAPVGPRPGPYGGVPSGPRPGHRPGPPPNPRQGSPPATPPAPPRRG